MCTLIDLVNTSNIINEGSPTTSYYVCVADDPGAASVYNYDDQDESLWYENAFVPGGDTLLSMRRIPFYHISEILQNISPL